MYKDELSTERLSDFSGIVGDFTGQQGRIAYWAKEGRVEQLKALNAQGLSASQIAKQMGDVTRNAVIGKLHRLHRMGISNGARAMRTYAKRKPKVSRPMNFGRPTWTESETALLKKLWLEGLPAEHIARAVSRSTIAVVNKAQVLRLLVRNRVSVNIPGVKFEPLPPEPDRPAVLFKLAAMEDDQCRFYHGDPREPDSGYCGCKKMIGSSYCTGHHGKVYTGVPVSSRSKDVPVWRGKHRLDKYGSQYAGKAVSV